jgi:hypothetical protein
MRRSSTGVLAVAAGVATIATVAVAPALTSARSMPAKRTVTFQEPRPRIAEDDIPPRSKSKLSLGDRLAIAGPLETASHRRLGTIGGTCTVVGAGGSFGTTPLLCEAVYQVAGGQIDTMGVMTLSRTHLAIVGGTGAYAGVHGFVTPGRMAKGFSDADKLTIER